jgi:hypothetical protein
MPAVVRNPGPALRAPRVELGPPAVIQVRLDQQLEPAVPLGVEGRRRLQRLAELPRGRGQRALLRRQRSVRQITFRDCKEVVGAGQQQVRFIWASIGAFHVCLWAFTMTEAWAWSRSADELVDRSDSPWDSPLRRPSHADKRRAWRRELLGAEIRAVLRPGATEAEIQATAERLLSLAA